MIWYVFDPSRTFLTLLISLLDRKMSLNPQFACLIPVHERPATSSRCHILHHRRFRSLRAPSRTSRDPWLSRARLHSMLGTHYAAMGRILRNNRLCVRRLRHRLPRALGGTVLAARRRGALELCGSDVGRPPAMRRSRRHGIRKGPVCPMWCAE